MAGGNTPVSADYLAPPQITVAAGYRARVIVPPGTFYDPLFPVAGVGDEIWLNDDGGEDDEGGGGIYSIARDGTVKALVPVGKIPPPTGIDRAPASFAPYAGQIFALAQPKKGWPGATENHVILRIDPKTWEPVRFAELPAAGASNELPTNARNRGGVAGAGVDMLFGPDGTAFAGRLFAVTVLNNGIYEVEPDGAARPFVIMNTPRPRQPICLAFAKIAGEDRMLVSTANGNFSQRRQVPGFATVTQIKPDGTVLPEFLVENLFSPSGLAYAPAGFGPYAGDLFVADIQGVIQIPAPRDQATPRNGKIFRIDRAGQVHPFAEGFATPMGLRFMGARMIICDINGDYIGGGIDVPDGFVTEITVS